MSPQPPLSQEQQRALKITTIERQTQALMARSETQIPARSARASVVSTATRGRPASQPAPPSVAQRLQKLQGIRDAILAGTGAPPTPTKHTINNSKYSTRNSAKSTT